MLMKVGGIEITTKVAWALIEDIPPLLGRQDIFDKFHIIFKQDKEQIIFEEI